MEYLPKIFGVSESDVATPEIDVRYTAGLARLSLTDEEVASFEEQFPDILRLVDTLSALNVEGLEPTAHPAPVIDVLREDESKSGLSRDQVLRSAPDIARGQIRAPKVVDA